MAEFPEVERIVGLMKGEKLSTQEAGLEMSEDIGLLAQAANDREQSEHESSSYEKIQVEAATMLVRKASRTMCVNGS